MESQGQGLRKAQTLRRKQQFGQHQGSQGSRPPPWQTAAYKVQGHSCDCPRPSLGSGSLAHSHPALGSRAGPHTPGATEAPGSEAEELWAPRMKQGPGSH